MTRDDVIGGIRDIFASELLVDIPEREVDLIEEGFLDSMDVVRLLLAMSKRFGISLELDDMELSDLGTVDSLANAVIRRS